MQCKCINKRRTIHDCAGIYVSPQRKNEIFLHFVDMARGLTPHIVSRSTSGPCTIGWDPWFKPTANLFGQLDRNPQQFF